MDIIDTFRVLLDSGEQIIVHEILLREDEPDLLSAGRKYRLENGEIAFRMSSGEFVVMRRGAAPEWGRRMR